MSRLIFLGLFSRPLHTVEGPVPPLQMRKNTWSRWNETPFIGTKPTNPGSPACHDHSANTKHKGSFDHLFSLLPSKGFNVLYSPEKDVVFRTGLLPSTITHKSTTPRRSTIETDAASRLPRAPTQHAETSGAQHHDSAQAVASMLCEIRSGNPQERKQAFKRVASCALSAGASAICNNILPLFASPALDPQVRHYFIKVIDRLFLTLKTSIRPFSHHILNAILPMLADQDRFARADARTLISNMSNAAGLSTMIHALRTDVTSADEHVRNVAAKAFAVIASALGVTALMPFMHAVFKNASSVEAQHTGVMIVEEIALLLGPAVLPHLPVLVQLVQETLTGEKRGLATRAARAIAALAEASSPYGIDCFRGVLKSLFDGVQTCSGRCLSAHLRAVGAVIPLMEFDPTGQFSSGACAHIVMPVVFRELASPDESSKRAAIGVILQCVNLDGVSPIYVRSKILPVFCTRCWVRRMAVERRNANDIVKTTTALSQKVGFADIAPNVVPKLLDSSERFRHMALVAITEALRHANTAELDGKLVERLVDGMLHAFQENGSESDASVLNAFGNVVNYLGLRAKTHLDKICGVVKWRLHNKSAEVRMQAADMVARLALTAMQCGEEDLLNHFGVILYEYLGEEFPEVLGSILGALRSIVDVVGTKDMTPPVRDLLPRLAPILKNRHEKVQENCIDLIGRIADRGADQVSAREWMRVCFELLELLKAPRKGVRRATVATFGFIAKAIGPQDVLHTLLNNLKVQDRQNRVCTTIAIAIVAETCSPFTVLPALMHEYTFPDNNVQNGVLKALAFLFQYIGHASEFSVCPHVRLLRRPLTRFVSSCSHICLHRSANITTNAL